MASFVVKVFNQTRMFRDAVRLELYMANSLSCYQSLKKLGVKVPALLNEETFLFDKFFIYEFIPHIIDERTFFDRSFKELSVIEINLLDQLKNLIELSFVNKLFLDLYPRNLRLHENNELVLVDFTEEEVDDADFNAEMCSRIKSWSNDSSILAYLTEKLPENFKEFLKTNP